MNTSRLARGAANASAKATYHLTGLNDRVNRSAHNIFSVRSILLATLVVRTITMTIPVSVAEAANGTLSDEAGQPPSTVAVVNFTPTTAQLFTIATPSLTEVQSGTSRATEAENARIAEEQAAQEAQAAATAAATAAAQQVAVKAKQVSTPSVTGPVDFQGLATQVIMDRYGLSDGDAKVGAYLASLSYIVKHESGFSNIAKNPHSSASGYCQFMDTTWKGTGYAKTTDPGTQLKACFIYADNRYGNIEKAADHWAHAHSW